MEGQRRPGEDYQNAGKQPFRKLSCVWAGRHVQLATRIRLRMQQPGPRPRKRSEKMDRISGELLVVISACGFAHVGAAALNF